MFVLRINLIKLNRRRLFEVKTLPAPKIKGSLLHQSKSLKCLNDMNVVIAILKLDEMSEGLNLRYGML